MLFYVVTIYYSISMRGAQYLLHLPNCLYLRRILLRLPLVAGFTFGNSSGISSGVSSSSGSAPVPNTTFTSFVSLLIAARGAISYCFVMTVLLSTNKMESVSKLLISSVAFDVTFGLPSVK